MPDTGTRASTSARVARDTVTVGAAAAGAGCAGAVASAETTMDEFVTENFKGLPARGVVLAGYPAEEILKAAETEQADLIVMGTHGRTGIDRIIFGSVAEMVVKTAACPVLTVKPRPGAA